MRVLIFGNKTESILLAEHLSQMEGIEATLLSLSALERERVNISGNFGELVPSGVTVLNTSSYALNDYSLSRALEELQPDVGFSYGWQRLIPANILDKFSQGVFGWHGSPFRFPDGRGRSPMNWALRLGLEKVFHHLFMLDALADHGPVIDCAEIAIDHHDHIADLYRKAHDHVLESAVGILGRIGDGGELHPDIQPVHKGLWLPKLSPEDSTIEPAAVLVSQALNLIRSASRPFPGARLHVSATASKMVELILWGARENSSAPLSVGEVEVRADLVRVGCKDGTLESSDFEAITSHNA